MDFVNGLYVSDHGNKFESLERCPKCGRTIRMLVTAPDVFDDPTEVDCSCDCMVSEEERQKRNINRQTEDSQIEGYFYNLLDEPKGKREVFDVDDLADPNTTTYCKEFCIGFPKALKAEFKAFSKIKKGIVFIGESGRGKTFFANCIGNALIGMGYQVLETNLSRLAADMNFNDYAVKLRQLKRYHLLIIDDWGTERKTEVMDELLQLVVDERYRQGLPIILTTNKTIPELTYPKTDKEIRIISRLSEMVDFKKVGGEDRRTK